ncbi:MAG: hypothetical protein KDJ52_29455 [Anaerolineae bacterium]|nr:hypothetical protein [Anaerolineae bacterium]
MSPIIGLQEKTINLWLDYLNRDLLTSDKFKELLDQGLISGTSVHPAGLTIAIPRSKTYRHSIQSLKNSHSNVETIYNTLMVDDIRQAAILFLPKYNATNGQNGFVNVSLSPYLADNTNALVAEAQKIWHAINSPNVMIKIPANRAGLPAIYHLIQQGINVNVTPLCGLYRYREVIETYITALEARARHNLPLHYLASVATFQLNVIDNKFDKILQPWLNREGRQTDYARVLRGQIATALAKMAFQIYRKVFEGWRFKNLAIKGAQPQHLVWSNTNDNNPSISHPNYDTSLIEPQTIITIAGEKINNNNIYYNLVMNSDTLSEPASKILRLVFQVDIDPEQVAQQLEKESIQNCIQIYDTCLTLIENQ